MLERFKRHYLAKNGMITIVDFHQYLKLTAGVIGQAGDRIWACIQSCVSQKFCQLTVCVSSPGTGIPQFSLSLCLDTDRSPRSCDNMSRTNPSYGWLGLITTNNKRSTRPCDSISSTYPSYTWILKANTWRTFKVKIHVNCH